VTHTTIPKAFNVSGRRISLQLSNPKNATPTVPRFGATYVIHSRYRIVCTKAIHIPRNIAIDKGRACHNSKDSSCKFSQTRGKG